MSELEKTTDQLFEEVKEESIELLKSLKSFLSEYYREDQYVKPSVIMIALLSCAVDMALSSNCPKSYVIEIILEMMEISNRRNKD